MIEEDENLEKKHISDQIAHLQSLRTLAERGRSTPLLGGEALIIWGVALSLMLGVFGIGGQNLPASVIWAFWVLIPLAGGIGTYLAYKQYTQDGSVPSYRNKIITRIWAVIIIGLTIVILDELLTGFTDPTQILKASALLFAIAMGATSVMIDSKIANFAMLGWLAMIAWIQLAPNITVSLISMSVACLLLLVLPGIYIKHATSPKTQPKT